MSNTLISKSKYFFKTCPHCDRRILFVSQPLKYTYARCPYCLRKFQIE